VLQPVGEVQLHADVIGRRGRQVGQRLLVVGVAAPEKDELGIARQQRARLQDQVEPFLGDQPAGHAEERRAAPLREAEGALQGGLAAPLALQLVGRVLRGDERIGGRVPQPLVDPVEHAHQAVAQPDEHVVQTEPAARRAKLAGLGRAHRGHVVGEGQPALEQVDLAVPLEVGPVVELPGQADLRHHLWAEMALVAGIVHRQHDARVPGPGLRLQDGADVHRRERGVPVVRVDEDPLLGEAGNRRHCRQREEGEPARVIGIVRPGLAIDAGPVEVAQVLDEEHLHAGRRAGHAEDPRLLRPAVDRDDERRPNRLEVGLVPHRTVERQDRHDVETGRHLEGGQARHRLGETAGSGVGIVLGADVDDGDPLAARGAQRRRGCRWGRRGG
jgi:hypothetical protein